MKKYEQGPSQGLSELFSNYLLKSYVDDFVPHTYAHFRHLLILIILKTF